MKSFNIIILRLKNLQRFDVTVSRNVHGYIEEVIEDSDGEFVKYSQIQELINLLERVK